MEHHLFSSRPHCFSSSLYEDTGKKKKLCSPCVPYFNFQTKVDCDIYVSNDITCSRVHGLENVKLPIVCLKFNYHCEVCLNYSNYAKVFYFYVCFLLPVTQPLQTRLYHRQLPSLHFIMEVMYTQTH